MEASKDTEETAKENFQLEGIVEVTEGLDHGKRVKLELKLKPSNVDLLKSRENSAFIIPVRRENRDEVDRSQYSVHCFMKKFDKIYVQRSLTPRFVGGGTDSESESESDEEFQIMKLLSRAPPDPSRY